MGKMGKHKSFKATKLRAKQNAEQLNLLATNCSFWTYVNEQVHGYIAYKQ